MSISVSISISISCLLSLFSICLVLCLLFILDSQCLCLVVKIKTTAVTSVVLALSLLFHSPFSLCIHNHSLVSRDSLRSKHFTKHLNTLAVRAESYNKNDLIESKKKKVKKFLLIRGLFNVFEIKLTRSSISFAVSLLFSHLVFSLSLAFRFPF